MALLDQLFPQFKVVEDFAVVGNPKRTISVGHGLSAARDIENAQAGMGKADFTVEMDAVSVRTAMREGCGHAGQEACVRSSVTHFYHAGNAAHSRVPSGN